MFLLLAWSASAQYLSNKGWFQVTENKGCVPFTVNITIQAPAVCDGTNSCAMDFEGNNQTQTLTFSYTYTQPGTYDLRILFQAIDWDTLQITAYPDVQPAFDVYRCGGNQVSYRITDTSYDQYLVDYNDGSPIDLKPSGALATGTHTYAASGSQTISVRGRNLNAQDNCTAMSHTFDAVATLPVPVIDRLTVLDPSTIQLDFLNESFIQYRLEIALNNASTFQFVRNLYNETTTTISNINTENNYYCFRIGAVDPCAGTTTYSDVICSSNFDLTVQNNANNVSWTTANTPAPYFANVVQHAILRDNQPYLNIPKNLSTASDINIVCGTTYCYQHVIEYANGSESYSLIKCDVAISTDLPTPVQNISSVVTTEGVALEWTQDPAFTAAEYSLFKLSNGTFALLDRTSALTYNDATYISAEASCYRINYLDQCNNQSSMSIEACPIVLTGAVQNDNSIVLNWDAYTGWQNGVANYSVAKYAQNGSLLQTFNTGTSTTLTDDVSDPVNQVYVYVVTATATDGGLTASVSNELTLIKEPNLYYPTAFTPNDDGLNDSFLVFGQYVIDFNMKIFNRWGELLFTTSDITQGWDGTFKGKDMPEGTYVFVADLTDFAGRTFNRSGSVHLLRKRP